VVLSKEQFEEMMMGSTVYLKFDAGRPTLVDYKTNTKYTLEEEL
jgi:hypothetical protein